MTRRSSTMRRPDGRIRVRTDLPADVVAEAKRIAADTGAELEVVLGDLAAVALPGLFVEVADDLVSRAARERLTGVVLAPDTATSPALAEVVRAALVDELSSNAEAPPVGGTPETMTALTVAGILSPGDPTSGSSGDGD